jgi:benzoate membrane transport protein
MTIDPFLAISLFLIYLITKRFSARYAIVSVLFFGFMFLLLQSQIDLAGFELKLASPIFTAPAFSINSALSIALPLFLITLTGQYMPGLLILKNEGFKTNAKPILAVTGLGSFLMAPFGSHAFNLAAITAAICTGKESHEDPSKRWVAGIAAGVFYILVGIFGVTLAAVFAAFPAAFISSLAGLALLGTIAGSLTNAMSDSDSREAALITFLATAANITLFGIGGAFWGLVLGLIAYLVLNKQFKIISSP